VTAGKNPFIMRTILVFLLIASLAAARLGAQEVKLGFVADQDILRQMPARNEVQRILDQETLIWDQKFGARQTGMQTYLDSVVTLEARLDTLRDSTLAAAKVPASATDSTAVDTVQLAADFERLSGILELKKKDLLAYYHQIYGQNGVLNRRNAELTQSVLEKLHSTIMDVSQTLQVSVMLDASALLYIDQDYNYTEQVMEALNIDTQRSQ